MRLFLAVALDASPYSFALAAVIGGGFIAAVVIGSIAWYNSKRPAGWEDKDRPTIVPKIDQD